MIGTSDIGKRSLRSILTKEYLIPVALDLFALFNSLGVERVVAVD